MKRLQQNSVATRLFVGLSILAAIIVGASLIGVLSFNQASKLFDRIASNQMATMRDANELRQQSQVLIGLAPSLFSRELNQGSLMSFSMDAYNQQLKLQKLVDSLGHRVEDGDQLQAILNSSNTLFQNADALATAIYEKAARESEQRLRLVEIVEVLTDARSLAASSDHSQIESQRLTNWLLVVDAISTTILKVSATLNHTELSALDISLTRQLGEADKIAAQEDTEVGELKALQTRITTASIGPRGVIALRRDLATNHANISNLLQKNERVAKELTASIEDLVRKIDDEVQHSSQSFSNIIADRARIMSGLGFLGILGAIAVGVYFRSSVILRLNRLRSAMAGADAIGNARALTIGNDELAEMARSVVSYVEEINARDNLVQTNQRRLTDAIESLEDGFSLYDAEDYLVTCNTRYGQLLYPGMEKSVRPGEEFQSVVLLSAERGLIPSANGRIDEWLAERLAHHRNPAGKIVQQRNDGRWIEIKERRTTAGDTVAIYTDITDQRNTQMELTAALEQVKVQNSKLESLSHKLSKYLSPQVYSTIFSGHKAVEISSTRKKLTVFFSDIVGFTEISDSIESEELTELLNHYLTEMSAIALAHGATIDKFIGDAIMIFFGDPETKGPLADALSCVEMAIAMQKRMRELRIEWQGRGIERPFELRIGVATGYCTVGNFGSVDRMDYTIIGNEVNLAARLQAEAEPGEILLAHETYSLVKPHVIAEERQPVILKGFSKPVRAYRLVGNSQKDSPLDAVVHLEGGGANIHVELARLEPDTKAEVRRVALQLLDALTK